MPLSAYELSILTVRSGLVFAEPADALNNDSRSHDAYLPWYHQTDPDFLGMCRYCLAYPFRIDSDNILYINARSPSEYDARHADAAALMRRERQPCNTTWSEVAVASAGAPDKLVVRLLGRYTALRYCIKPQVGENWLSQVENVDIVVAYVWLLDRIQVKVISLTPQQRESVSSLHCFTEQVPRSDVAPPPLTVLCRAQGPLGEQGRRKRQQKFNVMLGINTWVLRDEVADPNPNYDPVTYSDNNVSHSTLKTATSIRSCVRVKSCSSPQTLATLTPRLHRRSWQSTSTPTPTVSSKKCGLRATPRLTSTCTPIAPERRDAPRELS